MATFAPIPDDVLLDNLRRVCRSRRPDVRLRDVLIWLRLSPYADHAIMADWVEEKIDSLAPTVPHGVPRYGSVQLVEAGKELHRLRAERPQVVLRTKSPEGEPDFRADNTRVWRPTPREDAGDIIDRIDDPRGMDWNMWSWRKACVTFRHCRWLVARRWFGHDVPDDAAYVAEHILVRLGMCVAAAVGFALPPIVVARKKLQE